MAKDLRVIIVGGGHVGFHTAEHLDNRGHDVVIIEQDSDRCAFLNDQYVATVIEGDGTRPSILRQAQPERSDVIASLIGDRAGTNIGICMTTRRLAPDITTLARIDHGDDEEYTELVDAVVFPEKLAAHAATNEILELGGGGVRTIEEVTDDLEILEITVAPGAPAAGKRLEAVQFPRGVVVIPHKHGEHTISAETVLEPGVQYIVASQTPVTDEVIRLLRG